MKTFLISLGLVLISLTATAQQYSTLGTGPRAELKYTTSRTDTTADTTEIGTFAAPGTIYGATDTTHTLFGVLQFTGDTTRWQVQYRGVDVNGNVFNNTAWTDLSWAAQDTTYPGTYWPIAQRLHITEQFVQIRVIHNGAGFSDVNARLKIYFYKFTY